jgi:hypothetical protein
MIDFGISYSRCFDRKNWSVVLNCGRNITLPDGTILGNFQSGLYNGMEFNGDKLIIIETGSTEVSDEIADMIRSKWAPVHELFQLEEFKDADFYRSERAQLGDFAFSFWYWGERLPGPIHKDHLPNNFFELHTQVLGTGKMQKFHSNDESTLYEQVLLCPGQTHQPFFDGDMNYPWHRYESISRSILLAVESPYPIPK